MMHIALHILQCFPATCLNRDDVGAPKNLIFGGVTRARVSSQCWKRAIRLQARKLDVGLFMGERTRRLAEDLAQRLKRLKVDNADGIARLVCESFLSKKFDLEGGPGEGDENQRDSGETSTLLYFSPGEITAVAEAIAALDGAERKKALSKAPEGDKAIAGEVMKARRRICETASQAAKGFLMKDAADIALFGRMAANDPSITIEGAGLFNHAFSTHKCDNDLDFWTAVDDRKEESPGAANMGHGEFNAACYYRYVAVNLDLLKDSDHLEAIGKNGRQRVVRAFLRAALVAVPSAKRNTMNGDVLPGYAMGIVSRGQPFQLANAFEAPVRSSGEGWVKPSIEALEEHFAKMKAIFNLQKDIQKEVRLSEKVPINLFISRIARYVE